MPSNGILNGTLYAIRIGGTQISNLTSNSLSLSRGEMDLTVKESGQDYEFRPTVKTQEFQFEGKMALDAAYGYEDLYDAWDAGTAVTALLTTGVTGDMTLSGTGYVLTLDKQDPMEDAITFSGTLKISGGLTKGIA